MNTKHRLSMILADAAREFGVANPLTEVAWHRAASARETERHTWRSFGEPIPEFLNTLGELATFVVDGPAKIGPLGPLRSAIRYAQRAGQRSYARRIDRVLTALRARAELRGCTL